MEFDIKDFRLLKPTNPDLLFIEKKIREHERRFQWEGNTPQIEVVPLHESQDFIRFVKEPEWMDYKAKQDEEWAQVWIDKLGKKVFIMRSVMKIKEISKITEFEVKAAYQFLQQIRIPMQTLQNMIAITTWLFTGYKAYEIWPLGENPYEPMVELLMAGYVPRRLEKKWLVGYRLASP